MSLSNQDRKIRVLVVDDSAFMRTIIKNLLNKDPDIEVVGVAVDGYDALEKVKELQPDVVTLDVQMPRMDGLTFLKKQMEIKPIRVVMVSSMTREGAAITIDALSSGAIDFVEKPSGPLSLDMQKVADEMCRKVKAAHKARIHLPSRLTRETAERPRYQKPETYEAPKKEDEGFKELPTKTANKLVIIGSSTGGPSALMEVIPRLPKDLGAGVVVVQHMPRGFTKSLAERLNRASALYVKEAETGDVILENQVLIAPGGFHLVLSGNKEVKLNTEPPVHGVRPAIDVFIESAAKVFKEHTVGVILTGMGFDGAKGMKLIKELGGKTIAQDEKTSVIYGMPRAVVDMGLADRVAPLDSVSTFIEELLR